MGDKNKLKRNKSKILIIMMILMMVFSIVSCSSNNNYTQKNDQPYMDLSNLKIAESSKDVSEYVGRTVLFKGTIMQKLDVNDYYDENVVEAYEFKNDIDGPLVIIEFNEPANLTNGDTIEVEGYFAGKIETKNESGEKINQIVLDIKNFEPISSKEIFSLDNIDSNMLFKKEFFEANEVDRCRLEIGIVKFFEEYTLVGITFNNYNDEVINIKEIKVDVIENDKIIESKDVKYLNDTLSKADKGIDKYIHLKKINFEDNITIKATARVELNGEEKVVEVECKKVL